MSQMPLPAASRVAIGLSIPIADLAALDEYAERKGVTRSATLRTAIARGITLLLEGEPELLARYRLARRVSIKEKRRPRTYSNELPSLEGETDGQY